MLFDDLAPWEGSIRVDDMDYQSVEEFRNSFSAEPVHIGRIVLQAKRENATDANPGGLQSVVVTVRQYMTRKSMPGFDFMAKWNNDVPMPMRTMVGTIEKETAGMYYMKLHGELVQTVTPVCMMCGKEITNPVSRYFGLGPVCGGHNYVNPFATEKELFAEVEKYRVNVLNNIVWEGWIIKSAITSMEEYKCPKLD